MRVLFLNTDYASFLASHYSRKAGLSLKPYDAQLRARNESLFGTADFMSLPVARRGHAAIDVHANNRPLQEAWAWEHADRGGDWLARFACGVSWKRVVGRWVALDAGAERFREILARQIAAFEPSILYNHDPAGISAEWLKSLLPPDCALVGQIASPRGDTTNWSAYDLVVSSLPNFVTWFRSQGVRAEYLPLAFDPRVLERVPASSRDIPISFVGSLSPAHRERLIFLEAMARGSGIEIWGDGRGRLPPDSAIHKRHRGEAWGPAMFSILRRSQLTLNRHIDISEGYANNMRLFEATGMGACLLTDWKNNLAELFEPEKEVVTYNSVEECLERVRYLAAHDAERVRIASAGQARCLADHNYDRRMSQLVQILEAHFA